MTPALPASDDLRDLQAIATGQGADPADLRRLADEITAHGWHEAAVAALANAEAVDLMVLLLACRSDLNERADPSCAVSRLRRQAQDLEVRAERAWAEGAEFAGKAAGRRLSGEAALSSAFQRRADAAQRQAAALEDQALSLRLRAANIEGAQSRMGELAEALRGTVARSGPRPNLVMNAP